MPFRRLKLAGTAIVAAALLAPHTVRAQAYYGAPQSYGLGYAGPQRDRDGYPRAGAGRDGYARDRYYEDGPPAPRRAGYRERRARRGVHDRHRFLVITRHVMADADRDQLDRRASLDPGDHLAEMLFQIGAAVHRQGRIVDRRAVRDHHQDAPLLGPPDQPVVSPAQGLAVDILLEQPLAHHQAE